MIFLEFLYEFSFILATRIRKAEIKRIRILTTAYIPGIALYL